MFGFGSFGGNWGGALSDYVRVPFADHMLVPIPEGVSPVAVASASDNIPDAWRTVYEPLQRRTRADVLIVGGGSPSIGLYAIEVARALGAGSVTYTDTNGDRLGVAERGRRGARGRAAGAWAVPGDRRLRREPREPRLALRSTEPDGECTSTGIIFEPETPVPLLEMYTSGIHFHIGRAQAGPTSPRYSSSWRRAPASRARHQHVVPWDDAAEAVQVRSASW